MLTTKLVLLGMPTMLRQLLVRIVAQVPDLNIVAELPDDDLRSPRIMETPADVVVVDSDQAPMDAVVALLRLTARPGSSGYPPMATGRSCMSCGPIGCRWGELSPVALLEAIRNGEPRPAPVGRGRRLTWPPSRHRGHQQRSAWAAGVQPPRVSPKWPQPASPSIPRRTAGVDWRAAGCVVYLPGGRQYLAAQCRPAGRRPRGSAQAPDPPWLALPAHCPVQARHHPAARPRGWAVRVIHDTATLPAAILNRHAPEAVFRADETVEVV